MGQAGIYAALSNSCSYRIILGIRCLRLEITQHLGDVQSFVELSLGYLTAFNVA